MKAKIVMVLLLLSFSLFARSKNKDVEVITFENKGKISIGFKYENLVTETKIVDNVKKETVIKNYGQSSLDILFIDLFEDRLKNVLKMDIGQNRENADYYIVIHPTTMSSSGYVSYLVELEILDKNKSLISKTFIDMASCNSIGELGDLVGEGIAFIIEVLSSN